MPTKMPTKKLINEKKGGNRKINRPKHFSRSKKKSRRTRRIRVPRVVIVPRTPSPSPPPLNYQAQSSPNPHGNVVEHDGEIMNIESEPNWNQNHRRNQNWDSP